MGTPVKKSEPENVANVVDLYVDQLGPCGIPLMRLRHAACIVGDHLYIHGGRSGYRALRDFWRLNLKRLEWEAIQPINQTVGSRPGLLEDHIMVNYGSNLFLIGSGSDYLNRQEMQIWKFCPESWNWSRWIACKNSREHPLGRRSATGTMVANKLYIFGGIVDLYAKPTADLIELDLDNQAWSIVETWGPFVISPIYGHSTNFYSGRLIVFGGIKDQKAQNAVWSFDLSKS
ncbi:hypothetical protein BV898_02170 [Hypsibius exemplaris]|uniref:Uncharacterized protein n=1 Tax=Hypsibius exemplaris TaxID=2072580 RepID=A0A1W0X8V0_HYPEX|nr:hypothetical protein BV898_02170 [Hypsibius exemplaris]